MTSVTIQQSRTRTVTVKSGAVKSLRNGPSVVQVDRRSQVQSLRTETATVEVGTRGLQGTQGEPGAGGDQIIDARIAANTLGGHRIVRVVAGEVDYASADDLEHMDDVLGLTLAAAAQGASVQVLREGSITEPSWSWSPGEPLFLGINGLITQTPGANAFDLPVGYAETATTAYITIGTPIELV